MDLNAARWAWLIGTFQVASANAYLIPLRDVKYLLER
jgi:hypothetical protein